MNHFSVSEQLSEVPTATPPLSDFWAIGDFPSMDRCGVTLLEVEPVSLVSLFATSSLGEYGSR